MFAARARHRLQTPELLLRGPHVATFAPSHRALPCVADAPRCGASSSKGSLCRRPTRQLARREAGPGLAAISGSACARRRACPSSRRAGQRTASRAHVGRRGCGPRRVPAVSGCTCWCRPSELRDGAGGARHGVDPARRRSAGWGGPGRRARRLGGATGRHGLSGRGSTRTGPAVPLCVSPAFLGRS